MPNTDSSAAGELVLVLEMSAKRGNDWGQSRYESFARKRLWARHYAALARGDLPAPPADSLRCVTLRYEPTLAQRMAWKNAASRLERRQDWLVEAGYLAKDNTQVVPECPVLTQRTSRREPSALRVVIRPR